MNKTAPSDKPLGMESKRTGVLGMKTEISTIHEGGTEVTSQRGYLFLMPGNSQEAGKTFLAHSCPLQRNFPKHRKAHHVLPQVTKEDRMELHANI